jgi:hypothetical protein
MAAPEELENQQHRASETEERCSSSTSSPASTSIENAPVSSTQQKESVGPYTDRVELGADTIPTSKGEVELALGVNTTGPYRRSTNSIALGSDRWRPCLSLDLMQGPRFPSHSGDALGIELPDLPLPRHRNVQRHLETSAADATEQSKNAGGGKAFCEEIERSGMPKRDTRESSGTGESSDRRSRDENERHSGSSLKDWMTSSKNRIVRHGAFIGPGIIASVAYIDPGNWATDLNAGSSYGYSHLFVVLLAGLIALLFQLLSTRLGCASGEDLATHCRLALYDRPNVSRRRKLFYRWGVLYALYGLAELGIIFTDLAELLGSAIAINLVVPKIPLWACVALTSTDVFLVLLLFNQCKSVSLRIISEEAATSSDNVDWRLMVFLPLPRRVRSNADSDKIYEALRTHDWRACLDRVG